MSKLKIPTDMPNREPDLRFLNDDPIKRCGIPGVCPDDGDKGVLYFYDQPLLFAAQIEDQLVIATLTDQDYDNDGMKDGYAVRAKGWDQYLAISISADLLGKVYNSELPLRALYDQQDIKTWFVHKDWVNLDLRGMLDRFDPNNWYSVYRVWRGVKILDKWKSNPGVYLNPDKKDG